MRLSVVIATRDRAAALERALDSLAAQTAAGEFEVVVVDNGSADRTPEVARAASARLPLMALSEPAPNRGAARNRGIAAARGELVLFVDDDVWLPAGFVAAHLRAHGAAARPTLVTGPIVNVPSYESRPRPTLAHFSRAFLCTCNASLPRAALAAVGAFDEGFDLYGWEDTELGVRLREHGLERRFDWDAYLYHIKPPAADGLSVALRRTLEKARMAARLIAMYPSPRVRLATGAHPLNVLRVRSLAPPALLPLYAAAAESLPEPLARAARGLLLDGVYVDELCRSLGSVPAARRESDA